MKEQGRLCLYSPATLSREDSESEPRELEAVQVYRPRSATPGRDIWRPPVLSQDTLQAEGGDEKIGRFEY